MTPAWRINLLGILTAQHSGQEIVRFRTQKTAALFGYLALNPRPQTREALCTLLWPEADTRNGRNSLSVALSSLRTQLEPPDVEFGSVLVADRTLVSLNRTAVQTDLAIFQELCAAAEGETDTGRRIAILREAVALYRGRFLEGVYDDWVLQEAQLIEESFLSRLDELNSLLFKTGEFSQMQRFAERGVTLAPWRESNYANALLAMASRGDNEGALHRFETWRLSASSELPAPSRRLLELVEQIRAGKITAGPPNDGKLDGIAVFNGMEQANVEPKAEGEMRPVSSLPIRRTRFFGRRAVLSDLVGRLSPGNAVGGLVGQIVTLTGMGGSGKTRLATEAAHRLFHHYAGRLWFVGLASLLGPELLDVTLRDALQILPDPQSNPFDQVVELLAMAPALLILDNFEPHLPAGASWVSRLQSKVPGLNLMVTSRQRLGIEGEAEILVSPLHVPAAAVQSDVEKLLRFPSVQLFVDRAKTARPDFGITRRNAEAVGRLCRSLEGVPLALELAAARAGSLSPAQMLEQWEQRADFLLTSRRDVPERHRSMQAAIETSYNLLPTAMRRFFVRQAAFRGGWTCEAAAVVCGEPHAPHVAAQLRACSLLTQQDSGDTVRFSSLETLRDFARAQLGPEESAELRERHAHYFLGLIETYPAEVARRQKELETFRAELDNYRLALEWGHERDPAVALRLAVALWPWWEANGNLAEGREQLQRALDGFPDAPDELRAAAALGIARLVYYQDFQQAKPWLETALELYRKLEDKRGLAATLCPWSTLMTNLHDPQARDYAQEAWNLATEIGDESIAAEAAYSLALYDLGAGDMARSHAELEFSTEIFRRNEDLRSLALALDLFGMGLWAQGRLDEAERSFDEGLSLARRLKWAFMESHTLWGVSSVARDKGNITRALEAARESAAILQRTKMIWMGPYIMANLAHAEIESGEVARAVTLLGAAQTQHEALGTPLMPVFVPTYESYRSRAASALGEREFRRYWETGAGLSYDEAMELTMS